MAQVGIIMGSQSDLPIMKEAVEILEALGIPLEVDVVSAHRSPEKMMSYGTQAHKRGIKVIIAGAGGAAHLPGMIAAKTTVPVLGVPVNSKYLQGIDSLLSIVQMPKGIPVASFAIGDAGAANAGLFAVALLAVNNSELGERLISFRQEQTEKVLAMNLPQ